MPSKYADVIPRLPALPPADASYQDRVQKRKDELVAEPSFRLQPTFLGHNYALLRAEKDRINAELSIVNLHLEAITQLMIETLEADNPEWGTHGVQPNALRMSNGDTIRIQSEVYGQVEDKEAFRLWCIANGYETKLQLWPSTMNAIVKERAVEGEPAPDGTAAYAMKKIVYTPMKVAKETP